tara:strand:- start:8277 stop:8633 length:357 start_codon:yes stop_codon:yes gene_type:complete
MLLTLIYIIAAYLVNLFLPWWSVAILGLILGFTFKLKPLASFGWGFLALLILWSGQALFINIGNDGIMAGRIAEMLGVQSPLLMVLLTGVIGGVVGGLSTLCGSLWNFKRSRSTMKRK